MIVSLNEIESLALKACRGAGMSWGLAEEAGRAACWLALRGLPWDRSLAARLEQSHLVSPPCLSPPDIGPARAGGLLCPIHAGAAISDLIGLERRLTLHNVIEPIWVVPFADRRARSGSHVALSWDGGAIEIGAPRTAATDASLRGLAVERLDRLHAALHAVDATRHEIARGWEPSDGLEADAAAWAALEAWAARCYVPASLQSRLAGAGAGTSDND
jgi:hypothetical protein